MKKERWLSINIVSVLVILISLFTFSFYGVNSWFTQSHNEGVEIYVELSDIMLNVYQKIGGQNTLLTPINEEVDASHVVLAGAIIGSAVGVGTYYLAKFMLSKIDGFISSKRQTKMNIIADDLGTEDKTEIEEKKE